MKFLLFLLLIWFSTSAFSQPTDSLHLIYLPVVGYKIKTNEEIISLAKAMELMKNNPEAYEVMRKARRNAFGQYLLEAGGVTIFGPATYNILNQNGLGLTNGERLNLIPYLISGGILFVAGYPFTGAYIKHLRKAVNLYNQSL